MIITAIKYAAVLCIATLALAAPDTDDVRSSLKERFFHNNTAKFDKYCDKLYYNLAKSGNGTIDLGVLKAYYAEAQEQEEMPKEMTFEMDRADTDKDGKLTREEFCSGLNEIMEKADVDDLKVLAEMKLNAKWKDFVCKAKDKAPALFGGKCESQNLVKRELSAKTWKHMGIAAMVLGSMAALTTLTLLVAIPFAPAIALGSLPVAALAVAFWFVLGKISFEHANKLK
jgi:hypothetical protein